ncbi:hypothetical protein WHR41_09595, partial [Cladosporium halotolerans]
MERYASDSAVDYMQAYYKVALKRVVDDFSTLAVEQCLVGRLPFLFRPEVIHEMSEEEISQLASETEDTTNQRDKCMERLTVLQAGLHELRSLRKHRLSSQRLRSEPNGFDRDVKHEEDSIAENSASQAEETPGESPAEVTEEHPPAPDSSHEVSEEVAAPDTSDSWGFT